MKTETLVEMLQFRRMAGTRTIRKFEKKFLKPIFGNPDRAGNYQLDIGDSPNIIFAAHFDSVHTMGGMQKIQIVGDIVSLAPEERQSNCLGADCATGIWLILEMIQAGVHGRYIVHAEEESGCIGARWIVENRKCAMVGIDSVISFDRKGDSEIITHQSGGMTASDEFAESLSDILNLPLFPSPRGSFTDSYEYADEISECTNLAVGYLNQHSKSESQDLDFAERLRDSLIAADWTQLRFNRSPGDRSPEYSGDRFRADKFRSALWEDDYSYGRFNRDSAFDQYEMSMAEMVSNYPEMVADILESMGYDERQLAEEIAESYFQPIKKRGAI